MKIMRKKTYRKMVAGMAVGCGSSMAVGIAGVVTGVVANCRLKNYQKTVEEDIQRINTDIDALQADAVNHKKATKMLQEVCKRQGFLEPAK